VVRVCLVGLVYWRDQLDCLRRALMVRGDTAQLHTGYWMRDTGYGIPLGIRCRCPYLCLVSLAIVLDTRGRDRVWTSQHESEPVWTILDQSGPVWMRRGSELPTLASDLWPLTFDLPSVSVLRRYAFTTPVSSVLVF
jgi:hypothetical protein